MRLPLERPLSMTDLELWKMIKQGDKVAFEELYQRYYSPLFAYAVRMHCDEEVIKDSLQDLFVRIFIKHSQLPDLSYVKPYLYRSLTNALLDSMKSIRNNTVSLEELVDLSMDDSGFATLFEKNDADIRKARLLKKGFEQLSIKQKNALYLRFIQEFSWDELSVMFQMSPHSCMNLVGRAITKLRDIIDAG